MQFYPTDARVPTGLKTKEFHLRPLRVTDAEIDFAAVMETKESLRIMSQSGWPQDNFALEMNVEDLKEHEREHDERIAFTYTVVDSTGSSCLGCVYIEHLTEGAMKGDYVAMLRFWVRESYMEKDLDKRLLQALIDWFRKEWDFTQVVLTVAREDDRQNQVAKELGLQSVHAHETTWADYLIC